MEPVSGLEVLAGAAVLGQIVQGQVCAAAGWALTVVSGMLSSQKHRLATATTVDVRYLQLLTRLRIGDSPGSFDQPGHVEAQAGISYLTTSSEVAVERG